ncbi:MAG: hypothetical protein TEF_02815 [Rhizobiales bacterium NRL2]|jgi:nicotinate-nucleotide adenylyltransferase|nr:MAG: hypothetical protein TEF_02815 [Rhizobiales bacterium NRL2]
MTARLIIGGTFNPVHRGHLALAEGAAAALGVARVDFVPCHTPFHRAADDLLPFGLRCDLIGRAIAGAEGMAVNAIEADLPKPSLTWRTVAALREAEPGAGLYFALGQREFLRLHKWVNGRDIAHATHLAVAPRGDFDAETFEAALLAAWPDARPAPPPPGCPAAWEIAPGRHAILLDLPPVAISSTMIREVWRAGGDFGHLVPDAVARRMAARRVEIDPVWPPAGGSGRTGSIA